MVPRGVVVIRTRLFPRWVGWALLVNAAALIPTLYLPVAVWDTVSGVRFLWVLVMAIMMIRRPDRLLGSSADVEPRMRKSRHRTLCQHGAPRYAISPAAGIAKGIDDST